MMLAFRYGIKEKAIFPIDLPLENIIDIVADGVKSLPNKFFEDEEFEHALTEFINHKDPKIRAKAQNLLASVINNKKLNIFNTLFKNGLTDKEKKVTKAALKSIKSLKDKELKRSLIPQIQELSKHQDSSIQKLATKILENI